MSCQFISIFPHTLTLLRLIAEFQVTRIQFTYNLREFKKIVILAIEKRDHLAMVHASLYCVYKCISNFHRYVSCLLKKRQFLQFDPTLLSIQDLYKIIGLIDKYYEVSCTRALRSLVYSSPWQGLKSISIEYFLFQVKSCMWNNEKWFCWCVDVPSTSSGSDGSLFLVPHVYLLSTSFGIIDPSFFPWNISHYGNVSWEDNFIVWHRLYQLILYLFLSWLLSWKLNVLTLALK